MEVVGPEGFIVTIRVGEKRTHTIIRIIDPLMVGTWKEVRVITIVVIMVVIGRETGTEIVEIAGREGKEVAVEIEIAMDEVAKREVGTNMVIVVEIETLHKAHSMLTINTNNILMDTLSLTLISSNSITDSWMDGRM